MWQAAGASIVSPPSNEVYNALQTGVVERHRHQTRQLRLVPHLRAGEVPHRAGRQCAVVHVRAGADVEEELRQAQQAAAGRADQGRQEGAGLFHEGKAEGLDEEMVKAFEDNKVEVVTLTTAEYQAWLEVAQEELLRRVRQGSAERPEADRRGARGEIAISIARPAGGARRPAVSLRVHAETGAIG